MKTLKIHVFFLLTFAHLTHAQTSVKVEISTVKTNGSTVVDRANEKPLNLTIPMIGNISIHHANSKIRTATLALQTQAKSFSTARLISETKLYPEDPDKLLDPMSGGK
jgi:hypothetical protein